MDAVAASTIGDPVVYFIERQGITQFAEDYFQKKLGFQAIGGVGVISEEIFEKVENLVLKY